MKAGINYIGITTPFYCNDGNGKFLLHRRSVQCRDEHGAWDPGTGQLEFGQSLEESVLREVLEEYGVVGKIQDSIPPHSIIREWAGERTHWLAAPYFILVDPLRVKNNEPDKIDELAWFTLDTLPSPLHTAFQRALKEYSEYFEPYRAI